MGGLGFIFASDIAKHAKGATVLLTGRSALNETTEARLASLNEQGLQASYAQVDVCDAKAVADLMGQTQTLTGIIHSAGVIEDNYIINKDLDAFTRVMSPKVAGLVNLDAASADFALEHFVVFSSLTSALGNPGQADYAAGNGFMDRFVITRNQRSDRSGHTLAINWPLWADGGMQVDDAVVASLRKAGQIPLSTEQGLAALQFGLRSEQNQVVVVSGKGAMVRQLMNEDGKPSHIPQAFKAVEQKPVTQSEGLEDRALAYFHTQLAKALKLNKDRLDVDAPFENYGMDSIMAMDLTSFLEQRFSALSKTLFFEVQNVRTLSEYFIDNHRETLLSELGETASQPAAVAPVEAVVEKAPDKGRRRRTARPVAQQHTVEQSGIVIVGISGRYPEANNLDELWQNLCAGRDSITEIPAERWDFEPYYSTDKNAKGKSYSKWGGFIEGMEHFDPLFFNIAPHDAETIDPQETAIPAMCLQHLGRRGLHPGRTGKSRQSP